VIRISGISPVTCNCPHAANAKSLKTVPSRKSNKLPNFWCNTKRGLQENCTGSYLEGTAFGSCTSYSAGMPKKASIAVCGLPGLIWTQHCCFSELLHPCQEVMPGRPAERANCHL